MNKEDVVDKLGELVQLDYDAVHAYEQAINNTEHPTIRDNLVQFRHDHEKHIAVLSTAISMLGGTPPKLSRDIKGFFIEGFTSIRSLSGTEGVLKAMAANEKLTNHVYSEAFDLHLPANIHSIVERNYRDEQRHLRYIEEAIRNRIWERAAAHHA